MKKLQFIISLLFLIGCSSNQIIPSNTTPAILPPTSSVLPIQATPLPTLTLTPISSLVPVEIIAEINTECIEIVLHPERRTEGVLVFQSEFGSPLVFVNEQRETRKYVGNEPGMQVWGAYLSPNREWLIYELDQIHGETTLVLTQSDSISKKEIPYLT